MQDFKKIWYLEYFHRIMGRITGLVYLLPAPFIMMVKPPQRLCSRLTLASLGSLIVFQGLYGWYMVKSGLEVSDDKIPRVSHFRLAAHYTLATTFFLSCIWQGCNHILSNKRESRILRSNNLRFLTVTSLIATLSTSFLGCLVAGLDAGELYNTWPKMGSKFIPDEFYIKHFNKQNILENPAILQFSHRILSYITYGIGVGTFIASRLANISKALKNINIVSFLVLNNQLILGITTILSGVSISLASLHQMNSLLLSASYLVALFLL